MSGDDNNGSAAGRFDVATASFIPHVRRSRSLLVVYRSVPPEELLCVPSDGLELERR